MTGVLCDKKVADRFIRRCIVQSFDPRHCMVQSAGWMVGITRADHVREEKMRQRFGIAPIADELREIHLR
ncbi:hypothetical protein Y032_0238g3281 [Ancylostoma ceylanicum]|uniref:Uncharacterized protein n=1 Tax=Ancylostoma ceylanicum TaxID=53326 RepID=A0A016SF14_9BILA|nr:hypothetical protein Y032_0238g3281 [Ancylostoma ceylanicum]